MSNKCIAVLISLCGLLDDPNPESPLERTIAELYKHDRPQYDANARAWTREHARDGAGE
jgi:ubiquitin-conjugating enzyme E2 D/E